MNIIPAILTDDQSVFTKQMAAVRELVDWVQIDVQDGQYVASKTLSLRQLADKALMNVPAEADLMVNDPMSYLDDCKRLGFKRVIIHVREVSDPKPVLSRIRDLGMQPALALDPGDGISKLEPYIDSIEAVLIMTINPGPQGQEFIPECLEKSKQIRVLEPDIIIGIDGGVKLHHIEAIQHYPLDYVVVGSALWQAEGFEQALGSFRVKLLE